MAPAATQSNGFLLAHLSDPHLSSPAGVRFGKLLNKRLLGYGSWRLRRRAEHRSEVLDALMQDLHALHPDHVAVTGDLTHIGLPQEFRQVSAWLNKLGRPDWVTVVPGNHDTYIGEAWTETFRHWEAYMASDSGRPHPSTERLDQWFPILRVRGRHALIGISSAQPSMPFMATGNLGAAQLQALESMLAETGRQGLCRILLLHHPPIDLMSWRKRLTDRSNLSATIARQGVELILFGHAHLPAAGWLATPSGRAPAIGVSSASMIGSQDARRAQYHLYQLSEESEECWQLRTYVREYCPETLRFVAAHENCLAIGRTLVNYASDSRQA